MHVPKLIAYLRSFSKEDWKSYISYAKSSYANTSSQAQVISFYKSKTNYLHQMDWGKDKLLLTIKPKVKAHALSNILVKLSVVVEEYFIWQEAQSDKEYSRSLLLKNLAKRSLKKEFQKAKEDFVGNENDRQISLWDNLYQLQIEHLTYFENMTDNVMESRQVLERIIELSGAFYDSTLSYYNIELVNREVTVEESWDEVRKSIKDISTSSELISLSHRLIDLKRNRSHEDYLYLKGLLSQDHKLYSKELNYTVIIHLISYLNNRLKKGGLEYSLELLELYVFGLDSGLLINNGRIPIRRFYNILYLACRINNFDWAENFVDNYVNLVDSPNIKGAEVLAKSEIYFSQGNHEKVILNLVSTKYQVFDQELKARWLLLCSEFELNRDNVVFIEDRVRSMKYFLKRNKKHMDVFTHEGIYNLCNFLIRLTKPYDKVKLKQEMINLDYLTFRKWILSKV